MAINKAAGKINDGPSGQGPAGSGQGPEVEFAKANFDTSQWTEADWAKNYGDYYNRPDTPKPVEWGGYRGPSTGSGGGEYVVQAGDSYARIAGSVYGDQRMFADLIEANPGMTILQPGQKLKLPKKAADPFVSSGVMDAAKAGYFGGQAAAPVYAPKPGQYGGGALQSPDTQEAAANFYNAGGSQGQYGGEGGLVQGANGIWLYNGKSHLSVLEQGELNRYDPELYRAYKAGGLGAVNEYLSEQATLASVQDGSAFGLPLIDQRTGEAIDLNKPAWEQGTLRGQFGSFMGSTAGKAALVGASIIPETLEAALVTAPAGGAGAIPAAAVSGGLAATLMAAAETFYWMADFDPETAKSEPEKLMLQGAKWVGQLGTWAVNEALDTPRRTIEQTFGLVAQFKGSLYEPEKYGTIEELVGDLGAAWEAAKITYDSAPMDVASVNPLTWGEHGPGEWWNAIQGFESDVFVDYDLPDAKGGLAALVEARKKIIESGVAVGVLGDDNNPFSYSEAEKQRDLLLQGEAQKFGAPGQIRELMSGFVLDPLNYIGLIPASWLKGIAKAKGATTLLKAIDMPNPAKAGFIPPLDKALNYGRLVQLPQVYRNQLVHGVIQDAKALNVVQRMLVGEDILGVIEGKPYEKKWFEVWKHTPESNFREQLNQWNDYLQTYVFSGAETPEDAARMLDDFAKVQPPSVSPRLDASTGSASQTGGGRPSLRGVREYTAAEKAALTLQGQAIQKMIRNGGNVWGDVLQAWAKSADDRAPFEQIAKAMGIKVEDVVADFAKGKGEWLLEGVRNGVGEQGGAGVNLPEKFTVEYLTDAAKFFTKHSVPVSSEAAQAAMYAGLLEGATDFSINHFKIKPGNALQKISAVVKSAQSIVLLGGSPTYLINNVLNNSAMLLIHGIAGVQGVKGVVDNFAAHGLAPTRLTDSFAKAEFGAREAGRMGGLLGEIASNFESVTEAAIGAAKGDGGLASKIQGVTNTINSWMPFMQLAKKAEAIGSANAMWQGFSQMWARTWHRGVGFDKMPPELEAALRAIDPKLVEHIYGAAEMGLKPQDIGRKIFESAPKPEVERFIGGVFGERAPEVRELLGNLKTAEGKPLLTDLGSRILRREYTPENVRLSFAETVAEAEVSIAKHFAAEAKVTEEYVRQVAGDNEMGVTDAGALLMVFDDNREMLLRTFSEHKKILRDLYEARANGGAIDFREIEAVGDRLYKDAYFVKEKAALDSFVAANKKAGVKIDEGFIRSKQTEYKLTTEFFERKQKALKEFWDKPPSQRSGAEWERVQAGIDRDYDRLMTTTDKLRTRMDDYMAAAYEVKFKGSGKKLKEWRALAREHDRLYVEGNVAQFGEARRLKTLKERNESWRVWSEKMVKQRAEWFAEESKLRRSMWEQVPGEEAVKQGNWAASNYSPREVKPTGTGVDQPLPMEGAGQDIPTKATGPEATKATIDGIEHKLTTAQAAEMAGIEADYAGRLKATSPQDARGLAAIEARREKLRREVLAKPVVEEVKARLNVQDAAEVMRLPVEIPPAKVTREIARDKLVRVWGQEAGEVDAVLELWDRRAQMWSKETGRPADEWYASHVGDVVGGASTGSAGELGQSPIEDVFRRAQDGERLTFGDKIAMSEFIYGRATGEELARLGEIAESERAGISTGSMTGTFEAGQARRQIEAGILQRELGESAGLLYQADDPSTGSGIAGELGDALNFTRKGSVSFDSEGKALLRALSSPDVSTMVHETGHIFRRDLGQADLAVVGKWAGLLEGDDWNGLARKFDQGELTGAELTRYVEAEEKFARGFEEYLREGRAPTNALELVFEKFKRWLSEIYKGVGSLVEGGLTDEMRGVYGRLLVDYSETSTPEYVMPRSRFPEGVMADSLDMVALKEQGWTRGYKGLLNAINADRAKSGLPKFGSLAEVGAEEAMAAIESRLAKWATLRQAQGEKQMTLAVEQPRSELPGVLSNEIAVTAARMLEQLSIGEGPQLLKVADVEGGAEVSRYTRTSSSNPDWFQKFGEEFKTKNLTKAQFEKVLGKIIEDAGKDVGTNVERVKSLILDEMTQPDPLTGQPPNPEALRLLGKEQEALAAEAAWGVVREAEGVRSGASIADLRDDDVITLDGQDYTVLATDRQTVAYLYDADGNGLKLSAAELAGRDVRIVERPSESASMRALFQTQQKRGALYEPMLYHSGTISERGALYAKLGEVLQKPPSSRTAEDWALVERFAVTNTVTDIGNRALYEARKSSPTTNKPIKVSLDLDFLKWFNDKGGHAVGDNLLQEFANILKEVAGEDAYHFHGDEFFSQFNSMAEAEAGIRRLNELGKGITITFDEIGSEGQATGARYSHTGLSFGFGLGETDGAADNALIAAKQNNRSTRGTEPAGVVRLDDGAGGRPTPGDISDYKKPGSSGDSRSVEGGEGGEGTSRAEVNPQATQLNKGLGNLPGEQAFEFRPPVYQTLAVGQEFDHPQYGKVRIESFNEFDGTWIVREVSSGQPHTVLMNASRSPLMTPPGYMAEKGAWPRPGAEAGQEVWYKQARPMLDELQGAMMADAGGPRVKGVGGGASGVGSENLTPEAMGMLQDWVKQTQGKMGEAKLMSLKWAEYKRDAALLNYSRRYGYNTALDPFFPYHFFTTESMSKWALLTMQKPALLANYFRMKKFLDTQVIRPGFPTRLAGKVKIPIWGMPDWMGGGMWIDPMKIGINLESYGQPWEDYTERQAVLKNKTEKLLRDWQEDGKISGSEYEAAMQGSGEVWKRAQAELLKGDPSLRYDAADAMLQFIGPSMPLQWAYQYLRGTPERIGPTPLTRTVKTVTGALGWGGPGGWNIEEGIRRELDLPVFDQWNDYRVDRELAAMAADGSITALQARAAMIEREGAAYEAAVQRLTSEATWGLATLPLTGQSGQFFVTGEQEQRANKFLYSAAWDAYHKGDTKAISRFFDLYPEYAAQLALYNKPEERLQKFLVDQVYDGFFAMPALYKRELEAQLGDEWADTFGMYATTEEEKAMKKAAIANLDPETLAKWARTLGRYVPMNVTGEALPIEYAPPEVAVLYEQYNLLRDEYVTDEVRALQEEYFAIPADERVRVAPAEVWGYIDGKKQFGDVGPLWDLYHSLPKGTGQRKRMLEEHPEMLAQQEWGKRYLAEHPEVKVYLDSDAPLTRRLRSVFLDRQTSEPLAKWFRVRGDFLDSNVAVKPYVSGYDVDYFETGEVPVDERTQKPVQLLLESPEVWRVTYAHVFGGEALPGSVERKLKAEWQGQTGGQVPFEQWLQALVAVEAEMMPPMAMPGIEAMP